MSKSSSLDGNLFVCIEVDLLVIRLSLSDSEFSFDVVTYCHRKGVAKLHESIVFGLHSITFHKLINIVALCVDAIHKFDKDTD